MKTSGAKKIAERYVKALFDVSGTARDRIENDFLVLQKTLTESNELRAFLVNPLLSRTEQTTVVEAVLKKISVDKITHRFVVLLAKQKRLYLLPDIITLYQDWVTAARGEMKAKVISATPLKNSDIAALSAKLGEAYGKKILLETHEDPSLLGGVIIKIGSVQLDSSLSGKLTRLTNKLKAA